MVWGWGDGTAREMPAVPTQGPEFGSIAPDKRFAVAVHPVTPILGEETGGTPELTG